MIAPWVLDGAMNRTSFETYVERQLVPALKPSQVVMADNLASHTSPRVLELLTAKGCEIIVLPPYSPDLNPIEMAFSKLKTMRREIDPPDQFLTLLIPQGWCQDIPSSLKTGRTRLRPLHKPRMLKLL
jgi:transposase